MSKKKLKEFSYRMMLFCEKELVNGIDSLDEALGNVRSAIYLADCARKGVKFDIEEEFRQRNGKLPKKRGRTKREKRSFTIKSKKRSK